MNNFRTVLHRPIWKIKAKKNIKFYCNKKKRTRNITINRSRSYDLTSDTPQLCFFFNFLKKIVQFRLKFYAIYIKKQKKKNKLFNIALKSLASNTHTILTYLINYFERTPGTDALSA